MSDSILALVAVGLGWVLATASATVAHFVGRRLERRRALHQALACILHFRRLFRKLDTGDLRRWQKAWKKVLDERTTAMSPAEARAYSDLFGRVEASAFQQAVAEAAQSVPQYAQAIGEVAAIDPILADNLTSHAFALGFMQERLETLEQLGGVAKATGGEECAGGLQFGAAMAVSDSLHEERTALDKAIVLVASRAGRRVRRGVRRILAAPEAHDDAAAEADARLTFDRLLEQAVATKARSGLPT